MTHYVVKLAVTSVLIVLIAEVAKRSSFLAAVLACIPLVSVLAMVWFYVDTRDATQVAELASGVFWLVLPSLVLFIALPLLLKKKGLGFYLSLVVSVALTAAAYLLMIEGLRRLGIRL